MANQSDQVSHPPSEFRNFLPLKKRAMAEKSLPRIRRELEFESKETSEDDEDSLDSFEADFKKQKLEELQNKAYYSVLHAFKAEISKLSFTRNIIIGKLAKEWEIPKETCNSCLDKIEKDLACVSVEKKKQRFQVKLLNKSMETLNSSWGKVDPESLIGKWVRVKMTDNEHEDFIIKEYDTKEEMHRLETQNANAMEEDDDLSWVDLREIPREDIVWERGIRPNFDAPKQSTIRRSLF